VPGCLKITSCPKPTNGTAYFGSEVGTVTDVMESIRMAVSEVGKNDAWLAQMPPQVYFLHHDDPSDISEREPIIQTQAAAAAKVTGEIPPPISRHGGL
jgi:hypothetical protein